jgi:pimeloyl-ACP methyl ester carboxylesterase
MTAAVWSVERGDGLLVLFIHGAMDRSTGMARTEKVVHERGCDVTSVLYDRRGYGRSVDLPGPCILGRHIDDAEQVLAERPAVLVGHSYGGHVALGLAARRPDLARAALVYESPRSWEPWWHGVSAAWGERPLDPAAVAESFMIRQIGPERWQRLPERTRVDRRAEGRALVDELSELRTANPVDPTAVLCPVIVAVGSESTDFQQRGTRVTADELPRARHMVVDGAGHGVHLTHPGEFATLVEAAITSIDSGR